MESIRIDSNVKISESNYGQGYGKYPWRNMKEGDSFFMSDKSLPKPGYRPTTPLFKTISRVTIEHGVKGVRIWKGKKHD